MQTIVSQAGDTIRIATFNIEELCARYTIRSNVMEEIKKAFINEQSLLQDNGNVLPVSGFALGNNVNSLNNTQPVKRQKLKITQVLDIISNTKFASSHFDVDLHAPANKALAARVLTDVNADILCLCEVESLKVLDYFNQHYLPHLGYTQSYLVECRDPGPSNIAILSRYPILSAYCHKDEVTKKVFPKGCLEVDIICKISPDDDKQETNSNNNNSKNKKNNHINNNPNTHNKHRPSQRQRQEMFQNASILTIYCAHFKRAGDKFTQIRKLQSAHLVRIIASRWKQTDFRGNFVVMGDFNDTPEPNSSLWNLINPATPPYLENVVNRIDSPARRWTHHFQKNLNSPQIYRQLDYILLSHSLSKYNPGTLPRIIRSGLDLAAAAYIGHRYLSQGGGYRASDHAPVYFDLLLDPTAPYVPQMNSLLKPLLLPHTLNLLQGKMKYSFHAQQVPPFLPSQRYRYDDSMSQSMVDNPQLLKQLQLSLIHKHSKVDGSEDQGRPPTVSLLDDDNDINNSKPNTCHSNSNVNNNNNNNNNNNTNHLRFIPSEVDSKYIETISLMDGEDDGVSQIYETNDTTTIRSIQAESEYHIKSEKQPLLPRHLGVINLLDDDWNSGLEDNDDNTNDEVTQTSIQHNMMGDGGTITPPQPLSQTATITTQLAVLAPLPPPLPPPPPQGCLSQYSTNSYFNNNTSFQSIVSCGQNDEYDINLKEMEHTQKHISNHEDSNQQQSIHSHITLSNNNDNTNNNKMAIQNNNFGNDDDNNNNTGGINGSNHTDLLDAISLTSSIDTLHDDILYDIVDLLSSSSDDGDHDDELKQDDMKHNQNNNSNNQADTFASSLFIRGNKTNVNTNDSNNNNNNNINSNSSNTSGNTANNSNNTNAGTNDIHQHPTHPNMSNLALSTSNSRKRKFQRIEHHISDHHSGSTVSNSPNKDHTMSNNDNKNKRTRVARKPNLNNPGSDHDDDDELVQLAPPK